MMDGDLTFTHVCVDSSQTVRVTCVLIMYFGMKHYSAKALARCNHGGCLSTLELATG